MLLGLVLLMLNNAPNAAQNPAPDSAPATNVQAPATHPATSPTGFLYKTLRMGEQSFAYTVYIPPEYTPDRPWPAILFLHGSGERGGDGLLQSEVGIGTAIRRNRALCPAIVVMPQCRPGQLWVSAMAEMAVRCLDATAREYRVDPDRTYLTGLSMGGFGAWLLAERMPGRFAAVVPICGFYGQPNAATGSETLAKLGESLRATPIWCFHGTLDPAVPAARSREIVAAIRAAGGAPRYSEFPDGQHDVWSRAYADAELWRWMLAQRRTEGGAAATKPAP